MKQFLEDHKLVHVAVPTARLGHHHTQLRRVLVSRANQKVRKHKLTIQGFFMKKSVFAGMSVAGIMAVAVLTLSAIGPSHSVSALQLAQNSSRALANMTPKEAEYQKFHPYFVEWLQKAQQAPDLRVLAYDEVVQAYPEEMGMRDSITNEPLRVIDDPRDGAVPNIQTLKYLEFTITYNGPNDGNSTHKIVVGINEHNIPEAALMHFVSGPIEPRIGG